MKYKRIMIRTLLIPFLLAFVWSVDLNNASLSFPVNGEGYISLGNPNVNHITFEAWVRLAPNDDDALIASKYGSWDVKIVNDRLQFSMVQEWDYLWTTNYGYGTGTQYDDASYVSSHNLCNYGQNAGLFGTHNLYSSPDLNYYYDAGTCGYHDCINNCNYYNDYSNQEAWYWNNEQTYSEGGCSEWHYDLSAGRAHYMSGGVGYCESACYHDYTQAADWGNQNTCSTINSSRQTGTYSISATNTYDFSSEWHHVAVSFNGLTMKIFVNGIEEGTRTDYHANGTMTANYNNVPTYTYAHQNGSPYLQTRVYHNSNAIKLGKNTQIAGQFVGLMDDVRFWNIGRSGSEISQNKHWSIITPDENGNVAYYKFNQSGNLGLNANGLLGSSAVGGGIVSVPLPRPAVFTVYAQDGEDVQNIQVTWVDDTIENNTGSFKIYRNGNSYTSVSGVAESWTNSYPAADAGIFYNYCITALNGNTESDAYCDVGFIDQTGSMSGHIETSGGSDVQDVKLEITPNDGSPIGTSISFDGVNDYLDLTPFYPQSNWDKIGYQQNQNGSPPATFDLSNSNFTIEAWVKASSTSNRLPILSLENTTANKGLYLFTNSSHQVQVDLTNQAGPHSYLNGVWDTGENYTDLTTEPYLNSLGSWQPPEEWTDVNGNGAWDGPEPFTDWDLNGYWTSDVETYTDLNFNLQWDPPESFTDYNGDGRWNDAEPLNDLNGNAIWDDGEPFSDINNNFTWDEGEEFTDTNENSAWDPPESYTDTDGNGQWDAREPFTDFNVNGEWDEAEPFADYNGNGQYDANINEPFTDSDGNGSWFSGEQLFDVNNNNVWDDAEPWTELNDEVTNNSWHHVAVRNTGGVFQMFVDGRPSGSPTNMSPSIDANDIYIGRDSVGHYFSGSLDEIRIWNYARSDSDMLIYHDLTLRGNETGLLGYWKFDENIFLNAFDATTNNNHGLLKGAAWNPQNSEVTMGGYTDFYGNYNISKISYGSGTQYKILPSRPLHEFSPVFKLRTLNGSNPIADQVDFEDTSNYPVAGVVRYVGTDCFAADVFVYLDGQPVSGGITSQFGEFSYDVPIGQHYLSPVHGLGDFRPEHYPYCYNPDPDLADCPSPHNFTTPVTNILFYDHHKNKLTIDVSGGTCDLSLGAVEVRVQSTDPSSCLDEVYTTDATGHLELLLPPISYIVNVDLLDYPLITADSNPEFGPRTASLIAGDLDLTYKYYAPPNITLENIPSGCMGESNVEIPIYYQYDSDTLGIKIFEQYGYYNGSEYLHWYETPDILKANAECAVQQADAYITDNVADIPGGAQEQTLYNGHGFWVVNVGQPNILSGGGHPFQEKIEVMVQNANGTDTETVWALIQGKFARNQAFATTGPDVPTLILRDPPGDGSFAYMNETSSSCMTTSMNLGTSFGVNIGAEVHVGAEFEVGTVYPIPYFGVDTEIHADMSASMGVTIEGSAGHELEICTEVSETFLTSANSDIIGHNGDVFVGGALNILYGITDNIWLFSSDSLNNTGGDWDSGDHMQPSPNDAIVEYSIHNIGDCVIKTDRGLFIAPDGFATTYIFTEQYILDFMIPQLEFLAANADNVEPGEPYTDENNNGQYDSGEEFVDLNTNDQYDEDYTQSINDFNADIAQWMSHVNRNNYLKNTATLRENISFSAGADYEYAFSGSRSSSTSAEFSMSIENSLAIALGADVNGIGVGSTMEMTFGLSIGAGVTFSNENTTTTGFTLSDDDIGDGFTVDIMVDPVYSTPVFKLISAVTSCPYEYEYAVDITNPSGSVESGVVLSIATVPRDVPVFSVETNNILLNVPPDEVAAYTVLLGNASETPPNGEIRTYNLSVNQSTNPHGATIRIGGVAVEGIIPYTIGAFENINATITIERGPVEYEYDGIELVFQPSCDPSRAVSQFLTARFIPPCSPVSLVDFGDNWVINISNEDSLNITLTDYDLEDQYLQELRLEYKLHGTNQWILGPAISKDSVSTEVEYSTLTWQVGSIADDEYDVRAVAQCEANQTYTNSVIGVIDRVRPGVIGSPNPQDGVLEPNDELFVRFTENVNCNKINPPLHILLDDLENALSIPRDFVCADDQIYIMPTMPDPFMENRTLTAQLVTIEDMYGNTTEQTVSWDSYVNKNLMRWETARVNPIKYPNDHLSFEATLENTGNNFELWNLTNLPGWLTADVSEGELDALETVTITFDVSDNVNPGISDNKIYAETAGGNEDLNIHLRVLCTDNPDWLVTASDFQYTMSITAVLYVEDELSSDSFDMVSAWVDGELRGVAPVTSYEDVNIGGNIVDLHEVFLTVYSNQLEGEEIKFRVWDSSDCVEYAFVEEQYVFSSGNPLGLPTEPVTISASGAIVHRYDISPGWSWLSMNVESEDMGINTVMQDMQAENNDLIKNQTQFAQFVESLGWIGGLVEMDAESMYLTRVQSPHSFEIVGDAVDTDASEITIVNGWNWIGYLPQFITNTDNALGSLESITGDIVKSQFGFAQYVETVGWLGSLPYMNPKIGYMLRAENAGVLHYPLEDDGNVPTFAKQFFFPELDIEMPFISDIASNNEYSMSMILSLDKGETSEISEGDIIIAYSGSDIRGYANPTWLEYSNDFRVFLTIYSPHQSDEIIRLKLYDYQLEDYKEFDTSITFASEDVIGSIDQPMYYQLIGYAAEIPSEYMLYPNYPNPFNPTTTIRFSINRKSETSIHIFDITGKMVHTLSEGTMDAGMHEIQWNASVHASGVYYVQLTSRNKTEVQKILLLK